MKRMFWILMICIALCMPVRAAEETGMWQVSGGDSFDSLQEAVDACPAGGSIALTGNVSVTSGAVIGKEITVNGGGYEVDISGLSGALFTVEAEGRLTLQDILLDGGAIGFRVDYDAVTYTNYTIPLVENSLASDPRASASAIVSNGQLICDNVTVRNRYTSAKGGAVTVSSGSAAFSDCVFHHNYGASQGGAVYIGKNLSGATEYPVSSVSFVRCDFTENYTGHGGAVYAYNCAELLFEDCDFTANTANGGKGGALCLAAQNTTSPSAEKAGLDFMQTQVIRCDFTGNWAGNDGFAIQSYDSDLYVSDTHFTANVGVHPTSSVGTVSIEDYRQQSWRIYTSLTGCVFTDNFGACSCYGDHSTPSDLDIKDCLFTGNRGNMSLLLYSAVSSLENCRFEKEQAAYAVIDARVYENYDIPPQMRLQDVTVTQNAGACDILLRKQGHNGQLNTYTVILSGNTRGNIHVWDGNTLQVRGTHTGNIHTDSAQNGVFVTGTLKGAVTEHPDTVTVVALCEGGNRFAYVPANDTYPSSRLFPEENGKCLLLYTDAAKSDLWDRTPTAHTTVYGTWVTDLDGLHKQDGVWSYFTDALIDTSYTGLSDNRYGTWYIRGGTIDFTYTGLVQRDGIRWYVHNGLVNNGFRGLYKDGENWVYIQNAQIDTTYTGLAKNTAGWWYVQDGCIDFSFTGFAENEAGEWFVYKGQILFDYTGLWEKDGLVRYVRKGLVDESYCGVVKYLGDYVYVENGYVSPSYTGLGSNPYGTWYVYQGKVDFSFTGEYTDDKGGTWSVVKGLVQTDVG